MPIFRLVSKTPTMIIGRVNAPTATDALALWRHEQGHTDEEFDDLYRGRVVKYTDEHRHRYNLIVFDDPTNIPRNDESNEQDDGATPDPRQDPDAN